MPRPPDDESTFVDVTSPALTADANRLRALRCPLFGSTRKTTKPITAANATGETHARTTDPSPPTLTASAASMRDARCNNAAVTATAGNATSQWHQQRDVAGERSPHRQHDNDDGAAERSLASRLQRKKCATWTTTSKVTSAAAFEPASNASTRYKTMTAPTMMPTSAIAWRGAIDRLNPLLRAPGVSLLNGKRKVRTPTATRAARPSASAHGPNTGITANCSGDTGDEQAGAGSARVHRHRGHARRAATSMSSTPAAAAADST